MALNFVCSLTYGLVVRLPAGQVKHVDFYLKEANAFIPFEMLGGATPLEVYSGKADKKFSTQLTANVAQARISRMTFNRSQNCGRCPA